MFDLNYMYMLLTLRPQEAPSEQISRKKSNIKLLKLTEKIVSFIHGLHKQNILLVHTVAFQKMI